MEAQLRQIAAKMEVYKKQVAQAAAKALAEHAAQVAEDAKALAPVDTGELRDSIEVVKTDDLHYQVVAMAPYAIEVELGTATQAAQPFLFPAMEANKSDLKDNLAKALKNA
jgi:HK97 gp10 family phage protein